MKHVPAHFVRLLLSLAAMVVFCNCSSTPKVHSAQTGKVTNWRVVRSNEKASYAPAIFGAAHGGLIGSTIGRGNAAGIVGALSVGLIESYLFHRAEKRRANWSRSFVRARLDGSGGEVVVIKDDSTEQWKVGEPVLITYDKKGRPIDVHKGLSAIPN